MNRIDGMGLNEFPSQGSLLGKKVKVWFNNENTDYENSLIGTCVRDDIVYPFKIIFHLENGKFVLTNECYFQIYNA